MDALVIHPPEGARRVAFTLEPLLDAMSLSGLLRRAGWSVELEDGSFAAPASLEERLRGGPRPRVAWVHAPRARGLLRLLRALKEEGLVVGVFGAGAAAAPRELLDAGADVAVVSVAGVAEIMDRLSLAQWDDAPARLPDAEVLLEVAGVTVLDREGTLRASAAPEESAARPRWALSTLGVDLERHLEVTRHRCGRRLLPYLAAPSGARDARAGREVAEACVKLARAARPDELRFVDVDLARHRGFVEALAEALGRAGAPVPWSARAEPQHLDQPLLEAMRRGGCCGLCVCAELAPSDPAAPRIDDAGRAGRAAARLGLECTLELGVGGPGERPGDLAVALRRLSGLGPGRARVRWRGPGALASAEARALAGVLAAAREGAAGPLRRGAAELWRALRAAPSLEASPEVAGASREGAGVSREGAGVSREGAGVSCEGAGVSREGAGVSRGGVGASSREGAGSSREGRPGVDPGLHGA